MKMAYKCLYTSTFEEPRMGFEPTTCCLRNSTTISYNVKPIP